MSYDICHGCNQPTFRCKCLEPCANQLWNRGEPAPRTCERCGPFGPCPLGIVKENKPGVVALPLDDPEVKAMEKADSGNWLEGGLFLQALRAVERAKTLAEAKEIVRKARQAAGIMT